MNQLANESANDDDDDDENTFTVFAMANKRFEETGIVISRIRNIYRRAPAHTHTHPHLQRKEERKNGKQC